MVVIQTDPRPSLTGLPQPTRASQAASAGAGSSSTTHSDGRGTERIERLATKMKLVPPSQERAIVIERVTPAAPPGKSVVAAR